MTNKRAREALTDAISLASAVLDYCAKNKHCEGLHMYLFGLLAKIAGTARSIQLLVANRKVPECILLLRTMYEAAVQMEFIQHDPSKNNEIYELIRIEVAEDRYRELEACASLEGKSVRAIVKAHPKLEVVVNAWEQAKKHSVFKRKRNDPRKRWKDISIDEMNVAINRKAHREKHVRFFSLGIGNIVAHSKPLSMEWYVGPKKTGDIYFRKSPGPRPLYKPNFVVALAACYLAMGCNQIVNTGFSLGQRLEDRMSSLNRKLAIKDA